jgi:hypothetical protein
MFGSPDDPRAIPNTQPHIGFFATVVLILGPVAFWIAMNTPTNTCWLWP